MLQWPPLPAPSSRRSVPSGAGSRGRFRPWEGKGGVRDCDDVRDSSDAGPRGRRGPPGRPDRARARPRRKGRRHLAEPRRVGPQAPRLRDREEAGGRLPPGRVRGERRDARRDLPRAQDRRRGPAPPGDEAHRGLADERAARRAAGPHPSSGGTTGTCCARRAGARAEPSPSPLRSPWPKTASPTPKQRKRRSSVWQPTSTGSCSSGT